MKYLSGFILLLAVGCGSDSQTEPAENTIAKEDSVSANIEPDANTSTPYDQQWNDFQTAVLEKNAELVQDFMDTDLIDAESLIETLHADWILEEFKLTKFIDLKDSEYNEIPVKEFSVYDEFTDEEGNTYESATMFYFELKEGKMKLIGMLAAG